MAGEEGPDRESNGRLKLPYRGQNRELFWEVDVVPGLSCPGMTGGRGADDAWGRVEVLLPGSYLEVADAPIPVPYKAIKRLHFPWDAGEEQKNEKNEKTKKRKNENERTPPQFS